MKLRHSGLAVAAALASLAGCGADLPPASAISGLHFTSSTSGPNPPSPVDVTVTNATAAQNIYAATLALPDFPSGATSCPVEYFTTYDITFMTGNVVGVTADLNPSGCETVTISGSSTRRVLDDTYWATLAQNLGIAEATIYPGPSP
jgi:hypothetical protein